MALPSLRYDVGVLAESMFEASFHTSKMVLLDQNEPAWGQYFIACLGLFVIHCIIACEFTRLGYIYYQIVEHN